MCVVYFTYDLVYMCVCVLCISHMILMCANVVCIMQVPVFLVHASPCVSSICFPEYVRVWIAYLQTHK